MNTVHKTLTSVPLIEAVADTIREMLGDEFDAETFLDTLDGETNALDIMDALLSERSEAIAMSEAIKSQIADMTARRQRYDARPEAMKKAMLQILNATGLKKIERPLGTVSLTMGRDRVNITGDVPTQLCKTTVTPDQSAILKALKAGEDIPGAELEQGPDTITVRVR